MSRVVTATEVYSRRHALVLRRFEMRDALLAHAEVALPGLVVARADLLKRQENEEFSVDLALVDIPGDRWWVARVIANVDDLVEDILLPTHALRRTQYLISDAEIICAGAPSGDHHALRMIVLNQVPGVVTFVSRPHPDWFGAVEKYEGQLAVLEILSAVDGQTLLRLNGVLPTATGRPVGVCTSVAGLSYLLKLPGAAKGWPAGDVRIHFDGDEIRAAPALSGEDVILRLDPGVATDQTTYSVWAIADAYFELRIEGATR